MIILLWFPSAARVILTDCCVPSQRFDQGDEPTAEVTDGCVSERALALKSPFAVIWTECRLVSHGRGESGHTRLSANYQNQNSRLVRKCRYYFYRATQTVSGV